MYSKIDWDVLRLDFFDRAGCKILLTHLEVFLTQLLVDRSNVGQLM
jgi:hypothetical protein